MVKFYVEKTIKDLEKIRGSLMSNEIEFLIYKTPEEDIRVNAILKYETIWLTQKGMGELFGCTSDNISLHLKNIFSEGELNRDATTEKISVVQKEGSRDVKRNIDFYNGRFCKKYKRISLL